MPRKKRCVVRAQKRTQIAIRRLPPPESASSSSAAATLHRARFPPRDFGSRRPVCTPRCPSSDAPALHASVSSADLFFFVTSVVSVCLRLDRRRVLRPAGYYFESSVSLAYSKIISLSDVNRVRLIFPQPLPSTQRFENLFNDIQATVTNYYRSSSIYSLLLLYLYTYLPIPGYNFLTR